LVGDVPSAARERQATLCPPNHLRNWWCVYILSFAPLVAVTYKAWEVYTMH